MKENSYQWAGSGAFSVLIRRLGICLVLMTALSSTTFAGLWTPEDIETWAWYDASDTDTTIPVSGSLSTWLDKGTNSLNMSGGDDMKTGTRTINGMNVLDGNGNRAHVSRSGYPIPGSRTIAIFIVAAIDAVNDSDDCLFSLINSYNGENWVRLAPASSTQFNGALDSKNYSPPVAATMTGGPYNGDTNIFCTVFDNPTDTVNIYVDGTNAASSSSYTSNIGGSQTFYVFRGIGGSKRRVAPKGAIAEVVLVEDCPAKDRQTIEGYLAHKWGLEGNLPSNHPYRSLPPLVDAGTVLLVR